jgi:hypothetical protein
LYIELAISNFLKYGPSIELERTMIKQLAYAAVDAASIGFFCWSVYVIAGLIMGAA